MSKTIPFVSDGEEAKAVFTNKIAGASHHSQLHIYSGGYGTSDGWFHNHYIGHFNKSRVKTRYDIILRSPPTVITASKGLERRANELSKAAAEASSRSGWMKAAHHAELVARQARTLEVSARSTKNNALENFGKAHRHARGRAMKEAQRALEAAQTANKKAREAAERASKMAAKAAERAALAAAKASEAAAQAARQVQDSAARAARHSAQAAARVARRAAEKAAQTARFAAEKAAQAARFAAEKSAEAARAVAAAAAAALDR